VRNGAGYFHSDMSVRTGQILFLLYLALVNTLHLSKKN
jgi:hypothetical protein